MPMACRAIDFAAWLLKTNPATSTWLERAMCKLSSL